MVAASLVLFASVLMFQNGKPSYGDFAKHENLDLIVRGDSVSVYSKLQKAFNNKNYNKAEEEISALNIEDKNKVELQLYLGICLLEQDKFKKAEAIFTTIKNGHSIYKNKAVWYLALSKLKQEDYTNATHFSKLLPKDADDYDRAQKLLKKL